MRVNGASTHPQNVEVSFNGQKAMAVIPMLEVELHDEQSGHGSMALRANMPADVEAMKALFVPGSTVTFDTDNFTVTPPEQPPQAESQAA